MTTCNSCAAQAPDEAKFCPACGGSLVVADAPTIDRSSEPTGDATLHKPSSGPPSRPISHSSGSLPHGRFLPGMMIGSRYRIVSMLGRGGMGEVYRADDLSLGQQVALKFLPSDLASDPERLDRFRQEVRIARQVSHPNVCRVYDIGEVDGEHFISMEYVEGEDLGHLLKRIGQMPEAKAIQIARQIAAGLAAAHDRNLVHRDLKPANIMLDDHGMVRITDFGLAATVEELASSSTREGTPQYMAPEQLEGKAVTARSDIYSLGLVLYELFTGKRAFDATTLSELIRIREETDATSLSHSLEAIDPTVERVILRCLEREPARRPPTALAVSAALPGGDPLAAALAAGETPSPEMVAAAGDEDAMPLRTATILLFVSVVVLVALPFLSHWSGANPPLTIEYGPEVMKTKAREMLERLGFTDTPADVAYGYFTMTDWFDHIEKTETSRDRWSKLDQGPHPLYGFWYRESPEQLVNSRYFTGIAGGVVSYSSPYPRRSGEIQVLLDEDGRLWSLSAVPPQVREDQPDVDDDGKPGPFERLLAEAEVPVEELTEVPPEWSPRFFATERRAWIGSLGDLEMRLEAATFEDLPVHFSRVMPWTEPSRMGSSEKSVSQTILNAIQIVLFFLVIGVAILMARRNLKRGRGDAAGAFRLAVFIALSILTLWLFNADHVASTAEFGLLVIALSWSLFFGFIFWIVYVALEPYIRRRWPNMLISWSRLLSGRFRDPLVGRDLLVGGGAGILIASGDHLIHLGHRILGSPPPRPTFYNLPVIEGPANTLVSVLSQIPSAIVGAFFATFLLFLFLAVFRKEIFAAIGVVAIGSIISTLSSSGDWFSALFYTGVWALIVFLLVRFGMLAAILAIFTANTAAIAAAMPGGFTPLTTGAIVISGGVALAIVVSGFVLVAGSSLRFPSESFEG